MNGLLLNPEVTLKDSGERNCSQYVKLWGWSTWSSTLYRKWSNPDENIQTHRLWLFRTWRDLEGEGGLGAGRSGEKHVDKLIRVQMNCEDLSSKLLRVVCALCLHFLTSHVLLCLISCWLSTHYFTVKVTSDSCLATSKVCS